MAVDQNNAGEDVGDNVKEVQKSARAEARENKRKTERERPQMRLITPAGELRCSEQTFRLSLLYCIVGGLVLVVLLVHTGALELVLITLVSIFGK